MLDETKLMVDLVLQYGMLPVIVYIVLLARKGFSVWVTEHKKRTLAEVQLEGRLAEMVEGLKEILKSSSTIKEHFDEKISGLEVGQRNIQETMATLVRLLPKRRGEHL